MASVTVSIDEDVATRVDTAIAAGLGDHLPIGYWGGARYRSAMRFDKPAGWQNWTSITKATLTFYISDHKHVGIRNSGIYLRKMLLGNAWTKGAGTQDCEAGFSGSNTTQADDIAPTSGSQLSFSSGTTANAKKSIVVTAMVEWYWGSDQKPVFVFDPQGTDDYSELWSNNSPSNTYDPKLTIEYETASPPTAPTLVSPLAGEVVSDQTPRLTWTHNDPQDDAQSSALVEIYDMAGALITTSGVSGTQNYIDWPTTLTRGVSYQWAVKTADAVSGYGPYSAKRTFTVKGNPVVTIASARVMRWDGTRPRLEVSWTTNQPQKRYRVQVASPVFDSGWITGPLQTYLLNTVNLTDNVPVAVTVSVENTDTVPLTGSASRSFNPRYGLTVHKRDLGATPVTSWVDAIWSGTIPVGADIRVQYGSSAVGTDTAPATWYDDLASVPLNRYVFYRVWLLPSATAGPSFDKMVITSTTGVVTPLSLDKWSTTKGALSGLTAPWLVSDKEYVYGTRSAKADMLLAGATSSLYSQPITLRKDRSYILTGLMKSLNNSGATFELQRADGTLLAPCVDEDNNPLTLTTTKEWFDPALAVQDVIRYKTRIYKAAGAEPEIAYVVLKVSGAVGSSAWFDAIKLEESTVATPWSPGAVGSTIVDAGGVQIDGSKGGVFRYKGTAGAGRGFVEGGPAGLVFGTDTEITSPSIGVIEVNGSPVGSPVGSIFMWGGNSNIPTGHLLCDGASLLRTGTYADLFAAIGTNFGAVDGTHFSLPDFRQRFPLGKAVSGTGSVLGATGGTIDHVHVGPAHTHAMMHSHTGSAGAQTGAQANRSSGTVGTVGLGHTHPITVSDSDATDTSPATVTTAAANPPFITVNFVIKYA